MTPAEVLDQITRSGLRGRGGAGYPTGLKWNRRQGPRDRQVRHLQRRRGRPRRLHGSQRARKRSAPRAGRHGDRGLRGRRQRGYIYVRAEYPLAVKRLRTAIRQAERARLSGRPILDTAFSFQVDIRLGAGAFVCGEETALIASIEGKRGTPRPRPPYPAQAGLWGARPSSTTSRHSPTSLPSSATAATGSRPSAPRRARAPRCSRWPDGSMNTGLIEVPMGMTLREIIFEIGGGIPEGREFKAVQTGGPSGGCIPGRVPGYARGLRVARQASARSWAPAG